MVSKGFLIITPVITSIHDNLGTFLILGLSPAAIVFIILNFWNLFFVSFEFIAKPSNAVLLSMG